MEKDVEKENLDAEKHSECETSVCETKTNDSSSDIQAKASETNQQISCEKSKDQKVFECDICTYKTKSENGIKIHKAKKHTVTELLQTKLTIPIISQDVTAHTVTMILPLMNPILYFHQNILLVSPEARCIE